MISSKSSEMKTDRLDVDPNWIPKELYEDYKGSRLQRSQIQYYSALEQNLDWKMIGDRKEYC